LTFLFSMEWAFSKLMGHKRRFAVYIKRGGHRHV
jgi:hypothetical protein